MMQRAQIHKLSINSVILAGMQCFWGCKPFFSLAHNHTKHSCGAILYVFLKQTEAVRCIQPHAIGQCKAATSVAVHIGHSRAAGCNATPPCLFRMRTRSGHWSGCIKVNLSISFLQLQNFFLYYIWAYIIYEFLQHTLKCWETKGCS